MFKSSSRYAEGRDFFRGNMKWGPMNGWIYYQYLDSVSSFLAEVWYLFYSKYLACELGFRKLEAVQAEIDSRLAVSFLD